MEPCENSGKNRGLTETQVGRTVLDLAPLEIGTVASAEDVGGRDRLKRFCRHDDRVYP